MTLEQKLYNFLANCHDYIGYHFVAYMYRKGNISKIYLIINVLTLWVFPFLILVELVLTKRFHSPNCDCDDMKFTKKIRKIA